MKKNIFLLIMLCAMMAMPFIAAQTVTISIPSSGAFHRGILNVTATITGLATANNMSNATIWYRSGSSGAFTLIAHLNGSNMNGGGASGTGAFSANFSTSSVSDGSLYQFNVTMTNASFAGARSCAGCDFSAVATGITLDNTAPSIGTMTVQKFDKSLRVSCVGASDAIDNSLTFIYTLISPQNTLTFAANTSNAQQTFTAADISSVGNYAVNCRAIDDAQNLADAANQTFLMSGGDDIGSISIPSSALPATRALFGGVNQKSLLIGGFLLVVIVIAVVVIIMAQQSKGKRRR